jgi:putative transposase
LDRKEVALNRYKIIEPLLRREATLDEVAQEHNLTTRTLYNWVAAFEKGRLTALQPKGRSDKGARRSIPDELVKVIQGLHLRTPPVPTSSIHRQLKTICNKNGWRVPSYDVVHDIVAAIPENLRTLAHEGPKAYKHQFSLTHRFEAERPNEIWQADHTPLDIILLGPSNKPMKPWLTAVVDDYSRAVPGYYLGFEPPSSIRIALALRQAIWRKEDSSWTICGIPEKLYSDCGSDFTSNHIDQVSIDLNFETIQTQPGEPDGKGKCERFFLTVKDMLISALPGYAPEGHGDVQAVLTLRQLETRLRTWLVNNYLVDVHSETNMPPKERWENFPFVPRLPDSIDQLDLLLMTVATTRRVRRDGIRFCGYRYFDVELSGYVGEDVTIRYDPRDLAQIHVFANDTLICRASCFELSGKIISLKETKQARNHEAKVQRKLLGELLAVADNYAPKEQPVEENTADLVASTPTEYPKLKIKRFACDID